MEKITNSTLYIWKDLPYFYVLHIPSLYTYTKKSALLL